MTLTTFVTWIVVAMVTGWTAIALQRKFFYPPLG